MHDACKDPKRWPVSVDGYLNDFFQYANSLYSSTGAATKTTTKTDGGNVATSFDPGTAMSTSTDANTSIVQRSKAKESSTLTASGSSTPTSAPPPTQQQSSQPGGSPANPTVTVISTVQGQPPSGPAVATNNNQPPHSSGQAGGDTAHIQALPTTTSLSQPNATATAGASSAFSTAAIAGTAAGGAIGIALIICLVYLFMRTRKRKASMASPEDMWNPTHNTDRKPTLPEQQNDTGVGRYYEAPANQMSKAELHSDSLPSPPLHTLSQDMIKTPGFQGEGDARHARYYQPSQNYSELPCHPIQPMSSPTSPVSFGSTPSAWHPSGTPNLSLSDADLRSEILRSPVSELGVTEPLRSTRSAELSRGGDRLGVVEMVGENVGKVTKPEVSTNF